jgi:1-acyl-sn-glycerol-3-phosphate acyltransferase
MNFVRTLLTFGSVLLLTVLFAPVVSLLSLGNPRWGDPILRFWAKSILSAAAVRVEALGLENLPPDSCVMVSNHQSNFDVLLILARIRKHLRFVAKKELYRIPLFGMALRATGNIEVDRSGGEGDRKKLEQAISAVRERVSIVFFAEGTRSPSGELRPFKKGAAVLAVQAQVPLVPIAVAGTREILPKKSIWIRGGRRALLRVGKPLPTIGLTVEDRDRLTQVAQNEVQSMLSSANAALARASPL